MEKSVPVHHRSIWWYDQSSGLNSPSLAEVHILLSQGVDMIISLIHVFFLCSLMCSNTQNQHIIHLGFKDLSVSALIGVSLWSLFKSPYFQGPMRPETDHMSWPTRLDTLLYSTDEVQRSYYSATNEARIIQSRPTRLDPYCSWPTRPNTHLKLWAYYDKLHDQWGRIFSQMIGEPLGILWRMSLPFVYTLRTFL